MAVRSAGPSISTLAAMSGNSAVRLPSICAQRLLLLSPAGADVAEVPVAPMPSSCKHRLRSARIASPSQRVSACGTRLASQSHYPDQQELAIIDDHGGIDVKLSARNRIPATVTAVTAGEATANIELDAGGSRLVASITVEAAKELGLAPGTEVTAIIKASDVILAVAD